MEKGDTFKIGKTPFTKAVIPHLINVKYRVIDIKSYEGGIKQITMKPQIGFLKRWVSYLKERFVLAILNTIDYHESS